MNKKSSFLTLIAVCIFLLFSPASSYAQTVVLGSNCTATGDISIFSNTGSNNYLKFNTVDPNLNRLRIIDEKSFVYFDGRPETGQTIYLPAGTYRSIGWSGYGQAIPQAATGSFVGAPAESKTQTAASKPRTDYGFIEAKGQPDYTSVQAVGNPYAGYYNYYYNGYYYNNGYYYDRNNYYQNGQPRNNSNSSGSSAPKTVFEMPQNNIFNQPQKNVFNTSW